MKAVDIYTTVVKEASVEPFVAKAALEAALDKTVLAVVATVASGSIGMPTQCK